MGVFNHPSWPTKSPAADLLAQHLRHLRASPQLCHDGLCHGVAMTRGLDAMAAAAGDGAVTAVSGWEKVVKRKVSCWDIWKVTKKAIKTSRSFFFGQFG